uniref:Uncharacterized protein n=1 Tax=Panagrolaimus sp. JU765 TaxID=591449 RepID=A0AC34R1U6_9BILA
MAAGFVIFVLIFCFENSFGFFFGTSNCDCPPPAPPPICQPQACSGPSQIQYQPPPFPPPPPILYRPQPPVGPQVIPPYPNNGIVQPLFNFGSPPGNAYVGPPTPSAGFASAPSPMGQTISAPPIEPIPNVGADYNVGKHEGGYINKNIKNDEFALETLPPPPPAVRTEDITSMKKENEVVSDYDQQGDAIVPQIMTPAMEVDLKSENQIEVEPSQGKNEQTLGKDRRGF